MVRWIAAWALLLGLALAAPAAAEEEPPDWGYALAHDLMSPYCPGRTLAECPSPQADTLRLWILVQAAAGRSEAEVRAELYERFGEVLRAAPKAEGVGLAAYAVPAGAVVAGGLLLLWFLRRQTARPDDEAPRAAAPAAGPALDPELERRIDEDLAR